MARRDGEPAHQWLTVRDFGKWNTKAVRQALENGDFSYLQNFMSIGHGNIKTVPGPGFVNKIPNTGILVISPKDFQCLDFGNVVEDTTSAPLTLTLVNTSSSVLHITNVTVTGEFSITGPTTGTVPSGGTFSTTAVFHPTILGPETGTVTITSDNPSSPTLVCGVGIGVTPSGQPVVTWNPADTWFNPQISVPCGPLPTGSIALSSGNLLATQTSASYKLGQYESPSYFGAPVGTILGSPDDFCNCYSHGDIGCNKPIVNCRVVQTGGMSNPNNYTLEWDSQCYNGGAGGTANIADVLRGITGMTRATLKHRDTGKFKFEVQVGFQNTGGPFVFDVSVGLDANDVLTGFVGSGNRSIGYTNDGNYYVNSVGSGALLPVMAPGDVIVVEVDFDASTITFAPNNVFQTPIGLPGGSAQDWFPAWSSGGGLVGSGAARGNIGDTGLGRFKLADFTYAPRAGVSSWSGN